MILDGFSSHERSDLRYRYGEPADFVARNSTPGLSCGSLVYFTTGSMTVSSVLPRTSHVERSLRVNRRMPSHGATRTRPRLAESNKPIDYERRCLRFSHCSRILTQAGQFSGGVDQRVDLVGQGWEIIATNRGPLFEKMVGISLLLAWYRIDDHHRKAFSQNFRRGQTPWLADKRSAAVINSSISVVNPTSVNKTAVWFANSLTSS